MESQKKRINPTPRHCRLLSALLKGPVPREQADKLTPASNAPHYVMELRSVGIEIECTRRRFIDAEGFCRCPGTYHLTPESRDLALQFLNGGIPHEQK